MKQKKDLLPITNANAKQLRTLGANVLHEIDATQLDKAFRENEFQNIIFQFPHSGSREPIEGHSPNFILIRDFLISAKLILSDFGAVFISAVNNSHYCGTFQFEHAAEAAGFFPPDIYPFDPFSFSGYEHTMTHQEGEALDHHDEFGTWIFRKRTR